MTGASQNTEQILIIFSSVFMHVAYNSDRKPEMLIKRRKMSGLGLVSSISIWENAWNLTRKRPRVHDGKNKWINVHKTASLPLTRGCWPQPETRLFFLAPQQSRLQGKSRDFLSKRWKKYIYIESSVCTVRGHASGKSGHESPLYREGTRVASRVPSSGFHPPRRKQILRTFLPEGGLGRVGVDFTSNGRVVHMWELYACLAGDGLGTTKSKK